MQRPRRVFGYIRVSGEEQGRRGTSLDGQRDEIERYCRAHDWGAPIVFSEVQSGSEERLEKRIELQRLVSEVTRGDVILVSKTDRWSRGLAHGVASVRDLVKRGVSWISIGEGIDASTSQGDSTLGIMAWAADNERKRIIERTVGRRKQLRDMGSWVEGPAPFGYRRDAATKRLVVVDSEAAVVRDVYARCLAGQSISAIASELAAAGVGREGRAPVRWDKKAVHNLLRRRWYIGEMEQTDGSWVPCHPAIVDSDTFVRAQSAMAGRRLGGRAPTSESRTNGWLLRALATCGTCGSRMGSAYKTGDPGDGYYACATRLRGGHCDEPYARVSTADARASSLAARRLEELRDHLGGATLRAEAGVDPSRLEALEKSLESQRLRRARLLSLAVDGVVTKDELRGRLQKLDSETLNIEAALREEHRRARPVSPELRASVLRDVTTLRKAWTRLEASKRRDVLSMLIERLEIRDGHPAISWATLESLCAATVGRDLSGGTVDVLARPLRKVGERR